MIIIKKTDVMDLMSMSIPKLTKDNIMIFLIIIYLFSPFVTVSGQTISEDDDYATDEFLRTPPLLDDDDLDPVRIDQPDTTSTSTYPVGSPSGSLSTSSLGAAVYSVDINIPKGIAGMQPNISLVYNSQAGNSIAGMGFSFSCLSAISFTPRDLYHDGVTAGIAYNWTDALSLDGRRLLLVSGTHGVTGAVYRPEDDHFTTITLLQDSTTGKPYFEVVSPDGMRYHYGKGTGLHTFTKSGTEHFVSWYLTQAIDQYGHTVTYDYITDNLYKYLTQISYWNNTVNLSYENRANDPEPFLLAGVGSSMTKRLKYITSKTGSAIYRKYTLGYDTTSDNSGKKYSRLTSITESNGKGEALRPVSLNWNYLSGLGYTVSTPVMDPILDYQNVTVSDDEITTYLASDINQDGLSDILQMTPVNVTGPSGRSQGRTYVYVHMADRNAGGQTSFLSSDTVICEFPPQFTGKKHYNCLTSMSMTDLDGDGYNDIVLVNSSDPYIQSDSVYNNYAYVLGRDIVSGQRYHRYKSIGTHLSTGSPPLSVFDDFDRDGRTEIFQLDTDGSGGYYMARYIFFVRGDSVSPRTGRSVDVFAEYTFTFRLSTAPRHLFSGDFNCDGLADIAIFCDSGYKVFLNQGGDGTDCPFNVSHAVTGTGINYRTRMVQGDFNGDGLPDFLMNGEESANYYFVMCNGNGTFTQSLACNIGLHDQPTTKDDDKICMIVQDFDHDGKSDIILGKAVYDYHGGLSQSYSYNNTQFWWLRSTGTGLTVVRKSKTTSSDDARPQNIISGDFTGNGMTEVINIGNDIYSNVLSTNALTGMTSPEDSIYISDEWEVDMTPIDKDLEKEEEVLKMEQNLTALDGTEETHSVSGTKSSNLLSHLYKHTGMDSASGRITGVTDGLLNTTAITYSSLCDPAVYTSEHGDIYPLNDLTLPLSVVRQTASDNGAAGMAVTSYTYSGLKAHVRGRGLLGFTGGTVTDHTSGSVTSTHVTSMDSVRYVPLSSVTTTTVSDFTSSSESVSTLMVYADSTYALFPQSTAETDIYGHETVTTYAYNTSIGKPTSIRTNYDGTNMYKEQSWSSYVLKGGVYLPTSSGMSQKHADASASNLVISTYEYDNYGKMTRQVVNATSSNLRRETNYYYDSDGNLSTTQEQTGANAYLYTSYARQNVRDVTAVNTYPQTAAQTFTYDTWGNLLSESQTAGDTLSLVTTRTRDNWGNTVSVTSPTGIHTNYRRGWGSTSAKRYYVLEQTEGQPWVKTWYDSRGREVEVETVGPDRIPSTTSTAFNNRGLVASRTKQVGIRQLTTTYTYDALGRKTCESTSTGAVTTYSYGDWTQSTATGGMTYTQTFDAWGNVKTSSDPYATVTYTYGPHGKPTYIAMNSIRLSLTYDNLGNRTQLVDPDAGTISWQYDNCGRVTKKTDGRGKVSTYEYDALGNKTRQTVDGEVTDYVYDKTNHHLLWEKKSGKARRYVYDNKRRLTAEGTHISGETDTLYTSYTYDNCDRIASKTLPYGKTVTYTYDGNGYKTSSTLGADTLWRLDWFNGKKEITHSLGDSLRIIRKYDHEGRLYRSSLTKTHLTLLPDPLRGIAQTLQDTVCYAYDAQTGNLTEETSLYSNAWLYLRKYYSYDDADRLTGARTYQHNTKTGVYTLLGSDTLTYSIYGNIRSKTGVGTYTYGSVKPHAVKSVTNPDGLIDGMPQSVTYNGAGKVTGISEGDYTLSIEYGTEDERWRSSLYEDGNLRRSVRYGDGYDFVMFNDTLRRIYYLDENVILLETPLTGASKLYYAHTDRLGSCTDIMDGEANRVFLAEYDEWGKREVTKDDIGFIRGYTGHEMLPEFGLINMNGRMYDPMLARFLSPDDYVQLPYSPQGFNRYSYCMNNPLKYTDPSGEFWHLIIGAAVGSVFNWLVHGCQFNAKGLGYFGTGALAGALAAGVGAGISSTLPVMGGTSGGFAAGFWGTNAATVATSSFLSGAAVGGSAGFASGLVTGFGNALLDESSFTKALGAGGIDGLVGGISGGLIGGIFGGVSASIDGRRFWDGAKVYKLTLANQSFPIVGQNAKNNCVAACGESITNGKLTQDQIRAYFGDDPRVVGINDKLAWRLYATELGLRTDGYTINISNYTLDGISNDLIQSMQYGDRIGLTYIVSDDNQSGYHTVLLNKITKMTINKPNGSKLSKILFQVMDPAGGGSYKPFSIKEFFVNGNNVLKLTK